MHAKTMLTFVLQVIRFELADDVCRDNRKVKKWGSKPQKLFLPMLFKGFDAKKKGVKIEELVIVLHLLGDKGIIANLANRYKTKCLIRDIPIFGGNSSYKFDSADIIIFI